MTDHQYPRRSDAIWIELIRLRRIEEQAMTLLETSAKPATRVHAASMLRRIVELRRKLIATN